MWASPLHKLKKISVYCCRGRCPHRPERKKHVPLNFVRSAAAAQKGRQYYISTTSYRYFLSAGQGSPETIRFLARFWVLFPRGKSTPPETEHADSTTNPKSKQKTSSQPIFGWLLPVNHNYFFSTGVTCPSSSTVAATIWLRVLRAMSSSRMRLGKSDSSV